ncbi:MAG: roadblock/LC7 domain-containing protein [Candidatus Thorarchaeota archaeon]
MKSINELLPLLDNLKTEENLDGIIFAYRDGELIAKNVEDEFNGKAFLSMCASVLESAVGIGDTIGDQKINKIIVELDEKTILLVECDNITFLVLIINPESNVSNILRKLDEIIQKIVKMY